MAAMSVADLAAQLEAYRRRTDDLEARLDAALAPSHPSGALDAATSPKLDAAADPGALLEGGVSKRFGGRPRGRPTPQSTPTARETAHTDASSTAGAALERRLRAVEAELLELRHSLSVPSRAARLGSLCGSGDAILRSTLRAWTFFTGVMRTRRRVAPDERMPSEQQVHDTVP